VTIGRDFYELIKTYGGLSLEYQELGEGDFATTPGPAYVPPERGVFKVTAARTVQLLAECPGVVETFQTSPGVVGLPANTVLDATNDAGDGRIFFFKNSGTGQILIQDYLGAPLHTAGPDTIIVVLGNTANQWDFLGFDVIAGNNVQVAESGGAFTVSALNLSTTVTSATNLVLTSADQAQQVFTGSTAGQTVDLPDATTLLPGRLYVLWNSATQSVDIRNATSASLFILPPGYRGIATLVDNGTAAGQWVWMLVTEGPGPKAGIVPALSFTGSPKVATVVFAVSFSSANYTITLTGVDRRSWSYQDKSSGGFTINANANASLTDEVSWQAIQP